MYSTYLINLLKTFVKFICRIDNTIGICNRVNTGYECPIDEYNDNNEMYFSEQR